MTFGCVKGYCGPYKISKLYWKDAGQITLPDDDIERAGGEKTAEYHLFIFHLANHQDR